MSEVKDFCNPPRVVRTGMGWGVRIDGTDVFEGINQHGYKTLRTLDIVIGLSSEQEAKEYLAQWLSDQLPDFDAQRLRADTAEAELEVVRQQHAEQSCIFCNDSGELLSKVKTERLRADAAVGDANEADRKLAAAEQRIAKLETVLRSAVEWFDDGVGRSIDEFRMIQEMRAALNQKSEGESQ